jgi:hypothetical protein
MQGVQKARQFGPKGNAKAKAKEDRRVERKDEKVCEAKEACGYDRSGLSAMPCAYDPGQMPSRVYRVVRGLRHTASVRFLAQR